MQIQQNISLKTYNTFGIAARAAFFTAFASADELQELLTNPGYRLPTAASGLSTPDSRLTTMILGGGSNILFTRNFNGLVLKNEIKGITKITEDDAFVYIKAGAGENWHQFVLYCIQQNWAGVENLSLIPGNIGASPMQNIGAYGTEIKDVFYELEAFHLADKTMVRFSLADCHFGYRESVFKQQFKNQFAILTVTYKLRKQPVFNTSYGAIMQELEKAGVQQLSIKAIADAVIRIRSSKLPDPAIVGNAGSFFKNPQVGADVFKNLQAAAPGIIGYPQADGSVKLAAGWLIEQCGWKGYRSGDAGCHASQALVLVNYGNASGEELLDLSARIMESVQQRFGVLLEREVNII